MDCCLTTSEIHQLLTESGIGNLRQVQPSSEANALATLLGEESRGESCGATDMEVDNGAVEVCSMPSNSSASAETGGQQTRSSPSLQAAAAQNSGSGGYLEYIFRSAAKELFGIEVPAGPLPLRPLRNADLQEVLLPDPAGGQEPLLRFALAYGFRNIQSLMRRLKAGRSEYHYVEVMACPSGCLNGGGQLKPRPGQTASQLIEQLEAAYVQPPRPSPALSAAVGNLYREWVRGPPGSEGARQLLHTTYRRRERTVGVGLASDW